MFRTFSKPQLPLAMLLTSLLGAGCRPDGITVYHVAKEPTTARAAASQPADRPEMAEGTEMPRLTWTTPDGWTEQPGGDFRVASFSVIGENNQRADVSVIPLPGEAGGDLSNVNRWRGQVGQPPVSEDQLKTLAQPVEIAGQPAQFYEQHGEDATGNASRILAVIQRRQGTAWFFKMTGDDSLVAAQKPAFLEWLKSLRFAPAGED